MNSKPRIYQRTATNFGYRPFCYAREANKTVTLKEVNGSIIECSGAPELDTSFDTMRIEAGVQFLFAKAPIYKAFPIPFNDNRLYGNRKMVAVEPFVFLRMNFLMKGLEGVHRVVHLAAFLCDYSYLNSITADSPSNNSASFSAAKLICPSLV